MTKKFLKISKYKPSILQGRFEFNESVSLSLEHPRERMLLRVLFAALVALAMLYLYFVTSSVLNVIARKEALARLDGIQGSIGQLESRYLALSQGMTPEEGKALGLIPVENTNYVYRPGTVAATIARNAN